jgi:acyl-CoA reductase-like NAD-dependent aldehyde dehydrogenase
LLPPLLFASSSRTEYRPLEGFVLSVTPFNFTAIGGNLVAAPAIVGNVGLWKPSPMATYANYLTHQLLLEAGVPGAVLQFTPVRLRDPLFSLDAASRLEDLTLILPLPLARPVLL